MGISADQANTIARRGQVLRPRMLVEIGGLDPCDIFIPPAPTLQAKYAKSIVIQKQNTYGADRFKCVCALGPDQDYAFWAELQGCSLNLKLKYEGDVANGVGDWIQIFRGVADDIDVDCVRGEVIISGRNNAAPLIDAQMKAGTYNNMSKEDVIRNLAAEHGLNVEFGDAPPEGDFGKEVHDQYSHQAFGAQTTDIKKIDVIGRIAQDSGRTCYVKGDTLYMHKATKFERFYCLAPVREYDESGKICHLGPSNSTSLRFNHNFLLIKYNVVQGVHHDHHSTEVNLYKYPENACAAAAASPSVIYLDNKNADDAQKQVIAYAQQRQGFEWTVEWTTTGPEILDIEVVDRITVFGTNSNFDGPYKIYSIEHNISFERGLTTTITGKWGIADDDETDI